MGYTNAYIIFEFRVTYFGKNKQPQHFLDEITLIGLKFLWLSEHNHHDRLIPLFDDNGLIIGTKLMNM